MKLKSIQKVSGSTCQYGEPLPIPNHVPMGYSGIKLKKDQHPSQKSLLSSKIAVIGATVIVLVFALFCFTVRSFPGGLIRIGGPWNLHMEVQLGTPPPPAQPFPSSDRK
jgi:hypothetical protein